MYKTFLGAITDTVSRICDSGPESSIDGFAVYDITEYDNSNRDYNSRYRVEGASWGFSLESARPDKGCIGWIVLP